MILRALQHADAKHMAKNPPTHLYKHPGQPGTTHRVYRPARWPAINEVPSKEETSVEILLGEMLWQIRPRYRISHENVAFFQGCAGLLRRRTSQDDRLQRFECGFSCRKATLVFRRGKSFIFISYRACRSLERKSNRNRTEINR
jgi:hypothetical protein